MGRGIAQIAALAGYPVRLFDSNREALGAAIESIGENLERLVQKGKLDAATCDACLARLSAAPTISALGDCALVVEAIVENLAAKRDLVKQLETIIGPRALIASNTSSLSITAIGAGAQRPGRIVGWHFFNPVPLMKVVEVIDGLSSEPGFGDSLMDLSRRLGHTPVRAKDTPGFIVNHAGRAYGTEALRIVGEGCAGFADVDRVMRESAGFRLGPFELMDLTALDVSHPVMESIYHQFYEEARFRPSVITAQRLAGGLLGRKTQRGFYDYSKGASTQAETAVPAELPRSVWISRADSASFESMRALLPPNIPLVADAGQAALCIVTPLGMDATSCALDEGLDPVRTVAVDCFLPLNARRTVMTTPITSRAVRDAAHALLAADGSKVSVIGDSAGFITQRILAMIVNIACDIAQQRIATPADIDLAVRLGLNYPNGPLAMGDSLGASRILTILRRLQEFYGDPRYRPSPWLARRARLGVSLTTEEN